MNRTIDWSAAPIATRAAHPSGVPKGPLFIGEFGNREPVVDPGCPSHSTARPIDVEHFVRVKPRSRRYSSLERRLLWQAMAAVLPDLLHRQLAPEGTAHLARDYAEVLLDEWRRSGEVSLL